jgi:hypothetical protein
MTSGLIAEGIHQKLCVISPIAVIDVAPVKKQRIPGDLIEEKFHRMETP